MKPHKGTLNLWELKSNEHATWYEGIFVDHPDFKGLQGHTSVVVSQEGNEIETLNSRYTLGEPLPKNMAWINQ